MKIISVKHFKCNFFYIRKISEKYRLKKILEFTGWSEDELKKEIYEYKQDMNTASEWKFFV